MHLVGMITLLILLSLGPGHPIPGARISQAPIQPELWTMFFDGSLMKTGASVGLLFISPLGKHLRYVLRLHFLASNNVAKYEALVNGLRIAIELGVRHLDARGDS
jgi:hypothetical protein